MTDKAYLEVKHRGALMVAVMGVSIIQFLDMTIANVALPHMQTSLGASMDSISWVLTSYIIAGVLVLPITGWLSDRIGSRNLFLYSTAGFIFASMLCGAAANLSQMVIFRALQGVASAFIAPVSQTIMYDINPPSKQPRAMAIWGMVVMVAPISGPFLGGFLTDTLNWRWVYYVNLPVGIPSLLLLWWLLPSRPIVKRSLDLMGTAYLAIALAALQLMLDRGNGQEWFESPEIMLEAVAAIVLFAVFIIQSYYAETPLFDRKLMANKNFVIALGFMALLGVANVALASVLPTMYQNIYGYSVIDTGLLMAPRGCGVFCTMMIVNRVIGKVDSRILISSGYVIASMALLIMTHWTLSMSVWPIIIASFVQGLGLGFVFVPMNMAAFATLTPEARTDGAMLMQLFRNLGSSFGISVIVTMLARNIQQNHADIAGRINQGALDEMAHVFGGMNKGLLSMVDMEANRQALMISYLDNFYMLFWLILTFAPLAWFLRPVKAAIAPREIHID